MILFDDVVEVLHLADERGVASPDAVLLHHFPGWRSLIGYATDGPPEVTALELDNRLLVR
jgi:hypothetical protein